MTTKAWVAGVVLVVYGLGPITASDRLVARVSGEPVLASEVERELRLAKARESGDDAAQAKLWRAGLDQVVDRRLVLGYLAKIGEAASAKDVDLALSQFEAELKSQNLTLQQHCENVGMSKDEVRQALSWKASWKRYCDKQLSPANLEKYFERNRRDFDGTQLRVAQILMKTPAGADEGSIAAIKDRATQLRGEIAAGKVLFSDAAKSHSEAPSREAGGDIGWIERHRPMPEDFSRTAFALKKGEVSEPLVSSFGVHLITVLDEKPGTLSWRDVETELRSAVTLYLFRWIAERERQTAKIEYLEPSR